jgi:hypothetical protein
MLDVFLAFKSMHMHDEDDNQTFLFVAEIFHGLIQLFAIQA